MEPEGSLLKIPLPATCPYPEFYICYFVLIMDMMQLMMMTETCDVWYDIYLLVQLGSHLVAVVQYTFTHKQYIEQHNWHKQYIEQHNWHKQYIEQLN